MNAHMGTLELIADMASTTLSGLETAFTDILTGAKNAKDAFLDLGKAMLKTIASYFSQMLSGMLVTALFGDKLNAASAAKTAAQGTAAAGALAPASHHTPAGGRYGGGGHRVFEGSASPRGNP